MSAPKLSSLHHRALITGAGSGLGDALARALLAEGVEVWGSSRSLSRLESLCSHSPKFHPVILDQADIEASRRCLREVWEISGGLDLVILNAGSGLFGSFAALPWERSREQLQSMLWGTAALAHDALGLLKPQGPGACLVLVSSMAVEFPLPNMASYNMAKAGISALASSLLLECGASGPRVLELRPGDYRTSFNHAMLGQSPCPEEPAHSRIWQRLEANLESAPLPDHAASFLIACLKKRHRGLRRCGSFFQTRLAPLANRLLPRSWMDRFRAAYFHC